LQVNQSISQSINQSISQSVNQSVNRSISQSSIYQSTNQSIKQSINQSINIRLISKRNKHISRLGIGNLTETVQCKEHVNTCKKKHWKSG